MAHHIATRLTRLARRLVAAVAIAVLASCSKTGPTPVQQATLPAADLKPAVVMLRSMTTQANSNLVVRTDALLAAVRQFLDSPTDSSRVALQQAWLSAHEAFSASRALILGEHDDLLFAIDAWPIQPGFLDSLPQYPDSGIVNDFTVEISAQALEQQNGITDSEEVSLGFHPLEYYAFQRPATDFVKDTTSPMAQSIERRRLVVSLIANILDASVRELRAAMDKDIQDLQPASKGGELDGNEMLAMIAAGFRRSAHHEFQEASLLTDKDEGHCQFSQSSLTTLAAEMKTTRAVFESNGDLMKLLTQLDAATADNLETTLGEITAILAKQAPNETEKARLPLLLSAINHQFEDFERKLPPPQEGG